MMMIYNDYNWRMVGIIVMTIIMMITENPYDQYVVTGSVDSIW